MLFFNFLFTKNCFREHYQSVKRSGSKLFAKIISRRQKSLLKSLRVGEKLCMLFVVCFKKLVFSSAFFYSKIYFFIKCFRNTKRVSNTLDPDQLTSRLQRLFRDVTAYS